MKKFDNMAGKTIVKKGKTTKPSPETPIVLNSDDNNEGHFQEDDYIASNDNYVKCGASAQELARLVHVMADESTEEALQQLVTGYKTRQVLDDKNGWIIPWKVFSDLFNNDEFTPTSHLIDDANNVEKLQEIDPSSGEREVDDKKLKGKEPNSPRKFLISW